MPALSSLFRLLTSGHVSSNSKEDYCSEGYHSSMRQTHALPSAHIQFWVRRVRSLQLHHAVQQKAHIPQRFPQPSARQQEYDANDSTEDAGNQKNPEPGHRPDQRSNGHHEFDVAGTHSSQEIERKIDDESKPHAQQGGLQACPFKQKRVQG